MVKAPEWLLSLNTFSICYRLEMLKSKERKENVRNSIENKKVYSYVRLALNEREM